MTLFTSFNVCEYPFISVGNSVWIKFVICNLSQKFLIGPMPLFLKSSVQAFFLSARHEGGGEREDRQTAEESGGRVAG
jgi:hypothetical protein